MKTKIKAKQTLLGEAVQQYVRIPIYKINKEIEKAGINAKIHTKNEVENTDYCKVSYQTEDNIPFTILLGNVLNIRIHDIAWNHQGDEVSIIFSDKDI